MLSVFYDCKKVGFERVSDGFPIFSSNIGLNLYRGFTSLMTIGICLQIEELIREYRCTSLTELAKIDLKSFTKSNLHK